jgi:hypothetical protein
LPIRNFAYLFSENADGMGLTREENHLVTLISRRALARNRHRVLHPVRLALRQIRRKPIMMRAAIFAIVAAAGNFHSGV